MDHTHYAMLNEDNDVVAVIIKDKFDVRLLNAIEGETGMSVKSVELKESDYMNYEVKVEHENGFKYKCTLRPTWEY